MEAYGMAPEPKKKKRAKNAFNNHSETRQVEPSIVNTNGPFAPLNQTEEPTTPFLPPASRLDSFSKPPTEGASTKSPGRLLEKSKEL